VAPTVKAEPAHDPEPARDPEPELEPEPERAPEPEPPTQRAAPVDSQRELKPTVDALQEPFEAIDDAVLGAIAEDLRKYPEVEWACELADDSQIPVVGVRIEPSYLARASEIEAHIQNAARDRGVRLSVLLLTDNAVTKQARTLGRMFFPWKKKR
jgi:hypothetical protein